MKTSLLKPFERIPYFTLQGFKQTLGRDMGGDQSFRELLSNWKLAGRIIALKRGVYMTRRFYELHRHDVDFASAVSAILVPQSYLSQEYILQRSGVLTEATYPVSAITVKNTHTIDNTIGSFVYRHIKAVLYTGFSQQAYCGVIFYLASVAKALFDYFYFRPLPRELRSYDFNLAEDLRLNLDEFSEESRDEFQMYITASASQKMTFILENLRRNVWRP